MDDQKIENLLNLSLDAGEEERNKSDALGIGYDPGSRSWQVILRYHGNLAEQILSHWRLEELGGGYGIAVIPQTELQRLADLPEIEYIEKPKRLYFSVDQGRTASCISAVQEGRSGLTGKGVLMAVIDSGVDYFHPDFRNEDGTTRILALWDQTAASDTGRGVEYTSAEINQALQTGSRSQGLAIVPEQDLSGHGTQVLGIAAGNGRSSGGRFRGIAYESPLLVVKIGRSDKDGVPGTAELMRGLAYINDQAAKLAMPAVINLSFGMVYGSHQGSSLLENYIDYIADQGQKVIVTGMGNEGNTGGHAGGVLSASGEEEELQLFLDSFETTINIQLWKNYVDEYEIRLVTPDGRVIGPIQKRPGTTRYTAGNQTILVYYGEPTPYQVRQEIFFDFIPTMTYLDSGIWRILLTPERIVTGTYDLWLNETRTRGPGTRFLVSSPQATLTIPAPASRIIAAGAYDARTGGYALFSGRGWSGGTQGSEAFDRFVRPDLAAPGVNITTTAAGGGYISATGTSFAAPFVAGSAALLMEWGIIKGNDPYLYGEKVRGYLRKGARQLPGFEQWPNNMVGYGALCVQNSFPD